MKRRAVVLSPEAENDLLQLYDWIAIKAGTGIAIGYIERIEAFCNGLDVAAERGQSRDDIRPGLRILGFERRLAIAFVVEVDVVGILRVFSGGQNWESAF